MIKITYFYKVTIRKKKELVFALLYFASGTMLVIGNVSPQLAALFYVGIFLSSFLVLKGYIKRLYTYLFLSPYFIILGISIWNQIFPYYLGIILAILSWDLFVRIMSKALEKTKGTDGDFLVLPVYFFMFDFIFQKMPMISFIHMIPIFSPLAKDSLVVNIASTLGGRLTLLAILTFISFLMKILIHQKCSKACVFIGGINIILIISSILFNLNTIDNKHSLSKVKVAVVQGSYTIPDKNMQYEDYIEDKLNHYMKLAEKETADITVFPETEFGMYDVSNKVDKSYRENILNHSKQLGGLAVLTVTEGNSVTKSKDERFFSALLLENHQIMGITRKRNLVPFSETKRYSKGEDYNVYDTSFGKVGISICYDINANTVEKLKENGAEIILAPFNDGGFDAIYHNIHRYYPIMKAAELALPIAVANEDGISQLIDQKGNVVAEMGFGEKGLIEKELYLSNGTSGYLLFGRYLEWILFFSILGVLILIQVKMFRKNIINKTSKKEENI